MSAEGAKPLQKSQIPDDYLMDVPERPGDGEDLEPYEREIGRAAAEPEEES